MSTESISHRRRNFGFVMEQTLGHVTHYRNMRAAIDAEAHISASWYPLTFAPLAGVETLPLLRSNWSARASWRAWRTLMRDDGRRFDGLFFHTQVTTLLCAGLMRKVPTVISLDATPLNYDVVGAAYGHRPAGGYAGNAAEQVKRLLNKRSLHAAQALVTWCDWARQSLVHDYGIPPELISVIPPGVDLTQWPQPEIKSATGPFRILFVGADFARKGGETLLDAHAGLDDTCELHLVTKTLTDPLIESRPGVHIYRDVAPNSTLLKHLYASADIFVLPTRADCFPLVIQEAMAAGLPVISTDVGAIKEAVLDGETGLVVPVDDATTLRAAIIALANDPQRRRALGRQGRAIAEERFNSATNARRILNLMANLTRST